MKVIMAMMPVDIPGVIPSQVNPRARKVQENREPKLPKNGRGWKLQMFSIAALTGVMGIKHKTIIDPVVRPNGAIAHSIVPHHTKDSQIGVALSGDNVAKAHMDKGLTHGHPLDMSPTRVPRQVAIYRVH